MPDGLDLRHDVLDAQLVDRHCEAIGRCDTLTLELRDGRPPRVAAVVVGGHARHERIGRWMVGLARLFGSNRGTGSSTIPFSAVRTIGDTVELDVLRDDLRSEHVERWLSDHLICRIPGAQGKKEKTR